MYCQENKEKYQDKRMNAYPCMLREKRLFKNSRLPRDIAAVLGARQKILCKRSSTKSRMARNQRAYVGQIPLDQPSPGRMDGMRAACGVNAIQISREYYFKGDQPAFLSENMISN